MRSVANQSENRHSFQKKTSRKLGSFFLQFPHYIEYSDIFSTCSAVGMLFAHMKTVAAAYKGIHGLQGQFCSLPVLAALHHRNHYALDVCLFAPSLLG